ncbi:hypothetical protein [uncultured Methanolobus sp.]|nr:hypothetical protein [uncultured Methanolobus sp.]
MHERSYIYCPSVSKERMNYLVIFAFSIIAIVLSLVLDLGIV